MSPRTSGILLIIFSLLSAAQRLLKLSVPLFKVPFLAGQTAGYVLVGLLLVAGVYLVRKGGDWNISPLTLKKLQRFRSIQRGYVSFLLLLVLLAALRPAHAAAEVFGRWTTPGVSAVVELTPCSDGVTLCGTIRWLWDALDERGRPRLDAQNADTGLRTRPLVGVTILSGLKAEASTPREG